MKFYIKMGKPCKLKRVKIKCEWLSQLAAIAIQGTIVFIKQ